MHEVIYTACPRDSFIRIQVYLILIILHACNIILTSNMIKKKKNVILVRRINITFTNSIMHKQIFLTLMCHNNTAIDDGMTLCNIRTCGCSGGSTSSRNS